MQNIQILPIQDTDNKIIIEIMNNLSDYFSPETIEFAEEKIPALQWFVAKYQNNIIWFITFKKIKQFKVKIYWMGIIPSHQHQWIGSTLLQQTEKTLIEQWIKEIELLTLDEHPDYPGYLFTRNFYKKNGFEIKDFYMEEDIKILNMTKTIAK